MKLARRLFIVFLSLTLPLFAATDKNEWCGTSGPEYVQYLLSVHEKHAQELKTQATVAPVVRTADVGEIAVLEGNSNTLIQPNPFDLAGKKLTFKRTSSGEYTLKVTNAGVSSTQGNPISLQDDDSEEISFTSGFHFPFYDEDFTSVFINSDGNLTFQVKDDASSNRDTTRVLTGPPRVAPLFLDLDPSSRGEVRVLQTSRKLRITWSGVPEFGSQNNNTFQVTLSRSGKIEIVFGTIDSQVAVTGISPGKSAGSKAIDFSQTANLAGIKGAVLERFATTFDVDYAGLIDEFHRTHSQDFDFIVIFTDFEYDHPGFAFFQHIQNQIRGIGLPEFDASSSFGSPKVQGFLLMGFINNYPNDVNTVFLGENDTLSIMGQENGHRWLAFPRAIIEGKSSTELLGRQLAHWSFFMDSDASVMEGNDIRDNGDGTFTTVAAVEQYSKLDRYIIGLISPSKVKPFFVVRAAGNRGKAPQVGQLITGTRINVNVNDIIAAEGAREPSSADAPKSFKEAFIYLHLPGVTPSSAGIDHVERIRSAWTAFFRKATGKKGTIDATLK